jgi:hypothetical protein
MFWGGVDLQKVSPRSMRAVLGQAACTFGQTKNCTRVHATVSITAHVDPLIE